MKKVLFIIYSSIVTLSQAQVIWESPIEVAESSFGKDRPIIKLLGDSTPLVLWSNLNSKDTYIAKYDGTSFSNPTQLNPSGQNVMAYDWSGPEMCVSGNKAYVVYRNNPWENGHVYLVKSDDGGLTWSDTVRVDSFDTSQQLAYYPHIAVSDDTTMTIVFMHHDGNDNNPQYTRVVSNNDGQTFSDTLNLSEEFGAEACDCCPPNLISSGDNVVFTFRNNDNNIRDFKALFSSDGGNNFSQQVEVDNGDYFIPACPSSPASSLIFGDTLYSAYMSDGKVYIAQSIFSTGELLFRGILTESSAAQNRPRIATNGEQIVVVWEETNNQLDIMMNIFSADMNDYDFTKAFSVIDSSSSQYRPGVEVHDSTVYVVYTDNQYGTVQLLKGRFGYEDTTSTEGISEEMVQKIEVYPNPVANKIILDLENSSIEKVEIYDLSGHRIILDDCNEINTMGIKPGMYSLFISTKESLYKGTFIKR